jgi:hypothetical protein
MKKAKLLELVSKGVAEPVVLQLVARDCVDFEVTVDVALELTTSVPASILQAIIACRESMAERAPVVAKADGSRPELGERILEDDSILVAPFTGSAEFRTLAADTIVTEITSWEGLRVVQPETADSSRTTLATSREGALTITEARVIGVSAGARYALLGDINTYQGKGTLNAIATLRIIDVKSGEVLATSQKKCGLLIANSQQQCVVRAVRRASRELDSTFRKLGMQ